MTMKVTKSMMIIQSLVLILVSFVCGLLINSSVPIWITLAVGLITTAAIAGHIMYLLKAYHSIPKEDLNIESVEDHKRFLMENYDL